MGRVRRVGRRVNVPGWLFLVCVACVIELAVRTLDLGDSVAAPTATVHALAAGLASGDLSGQLGTTLRSYAEGLAIAAVVGIAVGIALGVSRTLHDATSPLIEFLRPIPSIAFIPLAIMVLGLGAPMHRFVVVYAAVWPILINTLYGVRGSDRLLLDVARTSGVGRLGRLGRVTLPAALPSVATGVRVSASIALLVAVTAEYLTGTTGIGGYMRRQQLAFHVPQLYAAILLTGLLGYAVDRALHATERRVVFWTGSERAAPQ